MAGLGSRGIKRGLALAPDMAIEKVEPWLVQVDYLLVLFVKPGVAGQAFMPQVLPKLRALDGLRRERGLDYQLFAMAA